MPDYVLTISYNGVDLSNAPGSNDTRWLVAAHSMFNVRSGMTTVAIGSGLTSAAATIVPPLNPTSIPADNTQSLTITLVDIRGNIKDNGGELVVVTFTDDGGTDRCDPNSPADIDQNFVVPFLANPTVTDTGVRKLARRLNDDASEPTVFWCAERNVPH